DSSLFLHYLPWRGGLAFVLSGAVLVALARWEPPVWRLRGWRPWSACVVATILSVSLLAGWSPWLLLYDLTPEPWRPWSSVRVSSARFGIVGNMIQHG